MTFVAKITSFLRKDYKRENPVFTFFFETKSREKKQIYIKALKKAQMEQEKTMRLAKEKTHA